MNNQTVADDVVALINMDLDTLKAYQDALPNIDNAQIHGAFCEFKEYHKKHIIELNKIMPDLGRQAKQVEDNVYDESIKHPVTGSNKQSMEEILRDMHDAEIIICNAYHDALSLKLPNHIKAVIESSYLDEQRCLNYIERALASRPWDHAEAPSS